MTDHRDEHDVPGIGIDELSDQIRDCPAADGEHGQHAPWEEHDPELLHRVDRRVVVGEMARAIAAGDEDGAGRALDSLLDGILAFTKATLTTDF